MRSAKTMLAAVERVLPGLTPREWGALAVAACGRAGLEDPDLRELQGHLEDQWAIDAGGGKPRLKRGDVVRLRAGGEELTVERVRDRTVPAEVDVLDGAGKSRTIPADLLAPTRRRTGPAGP